MATPEHNNQDTHPKKETARITPPPFSPRPPLLPRKETARITLPPRLTQPPVLPTLESVTPGNNANGASPENTVSGNHEDVKPSQDPKLTLPVQGDIPSTPKQDVKKNEPKIIINQTHTHHHSHTHDHSGASKGRIGSACIFGFSIIAAALLLSQCDSKNDSSNQKSPTPTSKVEKDKEQDAGISIISGGLSGQPDKGLDWNNYTADDAAKNIAAARKQEPVGSYVLPEGTKFDKESGVLSIPNPNGGNTPYTPFIVTPDMAVAEGEKKGDHKKLLTFSKAANDAVNSTFPSLKNAVPAPKVTTGSYELPDGTEVIPSKNDDQSNTLYIVVPNPAGSKTPSTIITLTSDMALDRKNPLVLNGGYKISTFSKAANDLVEKALPFVRNSLGGNTTTQGVQPGKSYHFPNGANGPAVEIPHVTVPQIQSPKTKPTAVVVKPRSKSIPTHRSSSDGKTVANGKDVVAKGTKLPGAPADNVITTVRIKGFGFIAGKAEVIQTPVKPVPRQRSR